MAQVTVGTTSVQAVDFNSGRKTIVFYNNSAGTQKIFLDNTEPGGLTATNAGIVLEPGNGVGWSVFFDGNDIKLPWSAIADGAGAILVIKETNETQVVKS